MELIYDKQDFFSPAWANLAKRIKTVYLRWDFEIFKIACLRWDLAYRLIWIRWIKWWCSLSLFWTGIYFLGKLVKPISFGLEILFSGKFNLKRQKLSEFKCSEFSGNVYLSCFGQKRQYLGKFGPKTQTLWSSSGVYSWTPSFFFYI